MLETIRQFAEEQLVARGAATDARAAHARYFAGREADILALWDSLRQREAYAWFTVELANLRTAFRWATDDGDLDLAAPIATYASLLGSMVENYEPIAWAEELIEPASAVDHPRLASLYVMATQCWILGRIDEAVRYSEAGQVAFARSRDGLPPAAALFEAWLGGVFTQIGQPDRSVEWWVAALACGRDANVLTRAALVTAKTMAGSHDAAMAAAQGLIEAAEATRNPHVLSFTLLIYGLAHCDADPPGARDAMRRGLVIAQDSGNRYDESHLAGVLGRLEARYGDPLAALDHLTLAIRNYRDSGNTTVIRIPLAVLAALLDRLGLHEPAATIAGFAFGALTRSWIPEFSAAITHLRSVLGDQTYESLARKGETMTTAAMVTYAYDQIDQARTELEHPS
jgi:tetratricopeptide (TPR) repeat protein